MIDKFTIEEQRRITEKLLDHDKVLPFLFKMKLNDAIWATKIYLKNGTDKLFVGRCELNDIRSALLWVNWGPAGGYVYKHMQTLCPKYTKYD